MVMLEWADTDPQEAAITDTKVLLLVGGLIFLAGFVVGQSADIGSTASSWSGLLMIGGAVLLFVGWRQLRAESSGSAGASSQSRKSHAQLMAMSPVGFERFVAESFRRRGWTASLTKGSGDEGVDIILRKPGRRAVVQCKRWKGTVGQRQVRELLGSMVHASADEAFLVTTGSYSQQARSFAQGKNITLLSGTDLQRW